jgi:hypothetical protein
LVVLKGRVDVERTPRYLEPQFEVGSLPVSEGAGMLLLGGGVGMIAVRRWCILFCCRGGIGLGVGNDSRLSL